MLVDLLLVTVFVFHVYQDSFQSRFNSGCNQGRIFIFSQEGLKNFRWGASHMQYAILDASEHFLKGVKKNLGGLTPPNPQKIPWL